MNEIKIFVLADFSNQFELIQAHLIGNKRSCVYTLVGSNFRQPHNVYGI